MKIYGKTISDIFFEMPWQYKIVMLAGISFFPIIFLNTCAGVTKLTAPQEPAPTHISRTASNAHIYDPSIASDGERTHLMAFTYLTNDGTMEGLWQPGVLLASSANGCKSWTPIGNERILAPKAAEIMAPDGQSMIDGGVWRYETPSVVYDPDDEGREWKLFSYRYFWSVKNGLAATRRYGFITYQETSDIYGEWSTEVWLMSPAPDYPPPPYQDMVLHHINTLHDSLKDVRMYSRPSVVYIDKALVMSLSAFTDKETPDRVVMLASFDHGRHWKYMGTPLRAEDVTKIGPYTRFGGASLLVSGEQLYLAAVLGDDETGGGGTFIFTFHDAASGQLMRDDDSVPVLHKTIPLSSEKVTTVGGGYAAWSDDCESGVVTAEYSGIKNRFLLFDTHEFIGIRDKK